MAYGVKSLDWQWDELLQVDRPSQMAEIKRRDTRISAALKLVRCGESSRAARVLTSTKLSPPTQETARKLRSKHPSATTKPNLNLPNTSHLIVLSNSCCLRLFGSPLTDLVLDPQDGGLSISKS